jgi:hypothetical protein
MNKTVKKHIAIPENNGFFYDEHYFLMKNLVFGYTY